MDIIRNMWVGICRPESISRLSLSLIIAALSSSPSFAEDGRVYPDTASVSFTRAVIADTVTLTIQNLASDSLFHVFVSDHTDSQPVFLLCLIDGSLVDSLSSDQEFGSVFPGKFTTRWIIGNFERYAMLRYYCGSYRGNPVNISGGHPFPIFGIIPGIGSPEYLLWQQ